MISPEPNLTIRPRLYESILENMNPDIGPQLKAVNVRHVAGMVEVVNSDSREIVVTKLDGQKKTVSYDRFVLATGSRVFLPNVPGLAEHGFNVDSLGQAEKLAAHLKALTSRPSSPARNTVVVAGAGLTGLEAGSELPSRLRAMWGHDADVRVVIVDGAAEIGSAMGAEAGAVIREALAECGVESRAGVLVSAVDADGVTLSSGERIEANTLVWAGGIRANALTEQVPGERDGLGRVIGDAYLRAPASNGIFVTGDTVKAATDDQGNYNVMSCQHALSLGRVAGHNAAAELVGLPLHPYSQPKYVTCLDLGAWGALYMEGWDRRVHLTREEGKKVKQDINTVWIYPPTPDREAIFAVANPDFVIVP